jgi:hypothetical protein
MRTPALLALGLLVFAGCVTPEAETPAAALEPGSLARLTAFDAAGLALPVPELLKDGLGIVPSLVGHRGGEPNVGVTSSGAVFMTAGHNTLRSTDHGMTWEIVFNLSEELPQMACPVPVWPVPLAGCPTGITRSSDPMLWVDTDTDRVFTDHMTGLYCSNMIWSDDEGDSWTMKPMTCGTPVNDHQKVATGHGYGPNGAPAGAAYPNPVYYCYNKLVATRCAVSLDGGATFPVETTAAGPDNDAACGGINGHPAPHPDGTMFVPLNLGCPATAVSVSEDGGLTWTFKMSPFGDVGAEELDPEITVTPDGTAYMLWRGTDHLQYLARSTDKFDTWEGPWKVSPEGVTSTVFAGLTSQVDGRIAFAFLGTRDTEAEPSEAENETRWHLFTGVSLDAAGANPTFVVEQVTPDEDPVQIGCVWLNGGGNPCRNMLDFIDMHSDSEGRVYIAYTEGCVAASQHPGGAEHTGETDCALNPTATNEESRGRHGAIAYSAPLIG